jgi:3-oxoacyl-[acyl-carrier protein] reductase
VNNAGTAFPKLFEETTLEEMDHVINLNLRGTLLVKSVCPERKR